jgi:hypothetical protein
MKTPDEKQKPVPKTQRDGYFEPIPANRTGTV